MAGIHGSLQATGSSDIAAIYGAILVKKPSELAPALAQHVAPVVIASDADPELKEKFSRLVRWQEPRWWFIAFLVYQLLAQAITREYHLDAKWHMKWKAIDAGGQITLTPKK